MNLDLIDGLIQSVGQGLPAIAACLAEGISINVTLIFSLDRYAEVMAAFLEGMERAEQAGHDLISIGSVTSFFVSRVDTEVDARLDKSTPPRRPNCVARPRSQTRALPTNATNRCSPPPAGRRCAPPAHTRSDRYWPPHRPRTLPTQIPRYIDDLIAPGVVNTMPEATLRAFADHGQVPADSVRSSYAEAHQVIDGLQSVGIGYDDVVRQLEDDGIRTVEASWDQLRQRLTSTLRAQAAPPEGSRG